MWLTLNRLYFKEFSNEQIAEDSNYFELVNNVVEIKNKIITLIGEDNLELIRQLERATDEIVTYDERRLIRFILTFIRKIFNK